MPKKMDTKGQHEHSLQRLRALRALLDNWGTRYAHTNQTFTPEELVFVLMEMVAQCEALWDVKAEDKPQTIPDRKSTRLNSSHIQKSRMPSSA